ncbi:hypothetical protein G6027_01240 [Dietzia sp. SLG310A2-38A2]|uniref:hypothetical protein n=1 Tax=Dietzia sp. SLG310A2-38A2 TaxID=1630643 RepID=UPI0015FE5E79|nr:hypothetical protein [Dietzia sp. SLG310A2-38A2]MBB1029536.1 hypothetical protein [Dietzia sp. SLG310A2-38A2]
MLFKRAMAVVAGAALPLATTLALAPTAGAQTEPEPPVTETVEVTYTCNANNASNIGGVNPWTNTVTVTYPESVAPGEFFDVTIQAGEMNPVQSRTGRVTYDIQTPSNVTSLASALSGGQYGFNSGTPSLTTVNPGTKVNAAGTDVTRIWGGTSARFGTSSGTSTNSGLAKTSNAAFRLPAVTFSMRAPLAPGAEVVFGLPGAGADPLTYNAENTQFAYTRGTSNTGTQVECIAGANAAQLTKTTVADVAPIILDSTTRIIGGNQTADSSIPVQLQAQVAAPYATSDELSQGTVTFRDQATNLIVGTANPNDQGIATIQHEFPRIPDGDPDEIRTIIAEYSGVPGNISSSQDTIVLTLTEKPTVFWNTNFTVAARVGTLGDESLPVNVTATFARPGLNFPEGTMVQLYRDALPVGEPVPMPATGASITFPTDEIDRTDRTGTHRYTVELETIWFDYNEWKGSTQNPAVVVVAGLDGEIITPEPGTGSLDLGSLTDPMTTSLSGSVGYDVAPLSSPTVFGLLSSAS